MSRRQQRNEIIEAPTKMILRSTFFEKTKSDKFHGRRSVNFMVAGQSFPKGPQRIEVVINKIEWEDGSGERFIFSGYLVDVPQNCGSNVDGFFRTSGDSDKGKGWISVDVLQQEVPIETRPSTMPLSTGL